MKKIYFLIATIIFFSLSSLVYAQVSAVQTMTLSTKTQRSKFIFTFDHPFQYQIKQQTENNLSVFFPNSKLNTVKKPNFKNDPLVQNMKIWEKRNNVFITISTKKSVSFTIVQTKSHDFIVVLRKQITATTQPSTIEVTTAQPVITHTSSVSKHPVISMASIINNNEKATVIIDPGHGGKDPGASGPTGKHEKTVVLAICKDLNTDLQQYAGIKTAMTRNSDYFVTLWGRLVEARKNQGDIFVAVHADSYLNNVAHGASVFALSEHGASSVAAKWLARRENEAVLGGAKFSDNSRDVQSVLLNLSTTATIADSIKLGTNVIQELGDVTHLHTGHIEQAPFMVLKNPDIPSILVETGFISNANEEANLSSPEYEEKLASAIATGIVDYLYKNPPQDSLIALQQTGHLTITVPKDSSVTAIARAYNVSADALREANDLHDNEISAGTELKIPRA